MSIINTMRKSLSIIFLCFVLIGCIKEDTDNSDTGYIVAIGDIAPDFHIKYPDGTTQSLTSLRDKVVLIQFAASWCKVCQNIMPIMESDFNLKYKDNPDFVMFAVCKGQSLSDVQKFAQDSGVTYPLIPDTDESIFRLYARADAGVTRNVLVDKDGRIAYLTRLYNEEEFTQLGKIIDALLQQ